VTKNKTTLKATDDNAETVTKYLLTHPNFFAEHPHVLTEMNLAHDSGTASSLIERQVSVLRMQNHRSRADLHSATKNARLNEQLSDKVHQLSLRLFSTEDLEKSLAQTISSLNTDFDIKHVTLRLLEDRIKSVSHNLHPLSDNVISTHSDDKAIASHLTKLERGEVVCGQLSSDQTNDYFGEHDDIASAALLPLRHDKKIFGIIGLGCTHEDRFRRDLGTVFLTRLAELISHKLWLDLNAK